VFSIKTIQFSGLLFLDRVFRLAVINFSLLKRAVAALQPARAFFFFRCSSAAFLPFPQNSPYIQAGSKKHQSSHAGYSGAVHNIYLPGGRRVRGFVGIEPLVHPCP
jgi:hypothetical protein